MNPFRDSGRAAVASDSRPGQGDAGAPWSPRQINNRANMSNYPTSPIDSDTLRWLELSAKGIEVSYKRWLQAKDRTDSALATERLDWWLPDRSKSKEP